MTHGEKVIDYGDIGMKDGAGITLIFSGVTLQMSAETVITIAGILSTVIGALMVYLRIREGMASRMESARLRKTQEQANAINLKRLEWEMSQNANAKDAKAQD